MKLVQAAVTCRIRSTLGNDLDIDIVDNEDGTFNLYFIHHIIQEIMLLKSNLVDKIFLVVILL